ncbi:hypothetical protein ABW20_dc0103900 [Dactylellina cionopaga]|nr:hypothetical protein ABW20_dc0103900 [Dactylellina cionopaga]
MEIDNSYIAPSLTSRFPSQPHSNCDELFEYSKSTCARSLDQYTASESVSHHAEQAACGGLYTGWVYPDGKIERLELIADSFSAGVFVDDLIDNATDMSYISDLISKAKASTSEPVYDPIFNLIANLYKNGNWNPEVLRIVRAEMVHYSDCTLALREIQLKQQIISPEEYIKLRTANCFMNVAFSLIGFAVPELAKDMVHLASSAPELFRRTMEASGPSVGIILDLYKINGKH